MGKELTKEVKETGIVNWKDELAKEARAAADIVPMPGGKFISLEGGLISIAGDEVRDNILRVIVLAFCYEYDYYAGGRYDRDNPKSPVCFALGFDGPTLAPHDLSEDKQSPVCQTCPQNKWGTATRDGRPAKGKACQNRYRLALLAAEGLSAGSIKDGEILYLRTPVTSSPAWALYVKGLDSNLHRPPWSVITELTTVKHKKNQFNLTYSVAGPAPDEYLAALKERTKTVKEEILFPYQPAGPDTTNGKEAKF